VEAPLSAHFFFLLLNPAISTLLGIAVAIIWYHKPDATFMRTAAMALFAFAFAFIAQDVLPSAPFRLSSLLINLAFLVCFTLFCTAMVQMAGGKPPLLSFMVIALATVLAILWWLYGDDNLANRVHVMNISHSLMCVLTIVTAWRSPKKGWGRNLAMLVPLLGFANFVWRPMLVVWEGNFYQPGDAFIDSVYWNTTRLGSPILAVLAAVSLMTGLSLALIKDLKLEARTDKLSGLLNRRGFEEKCLSIFDQSERRDRPITMMIADLDRFKQVNDNLGHARGDQIIQSFGKALQSAMPADAVIGRIGGEEFAVLLAGDETRGINQAIETCQQRFSQIQSEHGFDPITASFGIYKCGHQDNLHIALTRADKALYEAKHAGRNAVRTLNAPLTSVTRPA